MMALHLSLTVDQAAVLDYIYRNHIKDCYATHIAESLGKPTSTMLVTTRRLKKRGLIHTKDAFYGGPHQVRYRITADGRKYLDAYRLVFRKIPTKFRSQ